ncbi:O-antigen ligase family protein [Pedobacter endophyticus]|uniref:O-antigen ligase family protein n=1 Tax=Pedobacter endophyticus TaxID=2789740 RepID=A0A7U3Q4U5_9SPHI|nr:O-antigen ligase family protein [Pedobacter endophyticus]QPH38354.1 O-antigen ligase family protein [Pedobacter endophyticus]
MIGRLDSINTTDIIYKVIALIFIFIFYQQVLVINIGGSFKIYEFLGLILLGIFMLTDTKTIYSKYSLLLFICFVIAPIPGNLLNFFNPIKLNYSNHFPEAASKFRFNIWIAPVLIYLYYLLNWIVINYIIGSKIVFQKHKKLVKYFVISGSLISAYSFYGYFLVPKGLPDLVPGFLDYRNSTPLSVHRPAGFSAEPGSYVLMVMWLLLYLIFIPDLFKTKYLQNILLFCTLILLILTQSTSLIAIALAMFVFYFFLNGWKSRFNIALLILLAAFAFGSVVAYFEIGDLVEYIFIQKVENFFSKRDYVTFNDSGAIRSYTNYIGLKVFKANPIFGVGGGNSYFYMWAFENGNETGVITYDMLPQSAHGKILAELGLFGYIPFLTFFLFAIFKFYQKITTKCRGFKDKYFVGTYKVGFIGTLATLGMLLSIAPEYNLFIWVNIALMLNIVHHEKKINGHTANTIES